ncbi:MAG: glycoside hydrolase family 108 protein [Reyranella sp.]
MGALADKVEALISRLIEREGGYVNHPADRGGPTNWGITQATLAAWRGQRVTEFQVRTLSRDEARLIYRDVYFERPGFGGITDPELQELVFDFAVNSGPVAAAKGLQTALRDMGLYKAAIDGAFGPISRAALAACTNIPELYYRTKCERYELFLRFIGRDPAQTVFATGWANRLDELQDK